MLWGMEVLSWSQLFFIFSPDDNSPSKIMKHSFYLFTNAFFVLELFKCSRKSMTVYCGKDCKALMLKQ